MGAQEPINYNWSTGADSSVIENLTPGIYSCTLTDADACQQLLTAEVLDAECLSPDSTWSLVAGNSVTLNWLPVSNAFGYQLSGGRIGGALNSLPVSSTSKTISGLPAGESFHWRVRAGCQLPSFVSSFTPFDTFSIAVSRLAGELPELTLQPNPASDQLTVLFNKLSSVCQSRNESNEEPGSQQDALQGVESSCLLKVVDMNGEISLGPIEFSKAVDSGQVELQLDV